MENKGHWAETLTRIIPAVFVLLWSTGYITARYSMPYASAFGFLSIRLFLSILFIGGFAVFTRAHWPRGTALWSALVVGALMHGVYLGSIFWIIKNGFPAGFAGLLVGLQPIITVLFAALLLGERISAKQLIGLVVGLLGVAMVLGPRLTGAFAPELLLQAVICLLGVSAFSLGSVLQKKYGGSDNLAAGTVVQYVGAFAFCLIVAVGFEPFQFDWNVELAFSLAWAVLILSVVTIILLMVMIRAGEVGRVASLFYLIPAVTAVMAYFLFGESLNFVQIIGIVVTSAGVALATLRRSK